MDKIIAFVMENLIFFIAGGAALALIIVAVIVVSAVKKSNRKKREEYEAIAGGAYVVDIGDDEPDRDEKKDFAGKKADFAWVREDAEKAAEAQSVQPAPGEKTRAAKKTGKESATDTAKKQPAVQTKPAENKPAETKSAETKPAAEKSPKPAKKAVGKWVVKEKSDGEFVAYLYANNGEVILTSEIYASADGAKKGVSTIKKNVAGEGNFQIYCDKNRHYYFKLKNASNRFLCVGETYQNKSSCLSAAESVKRFADAPVQDEVEKEITIIKYVAQDGTATTQNVKSAYSGKWQINKIDDMYLAQLYASNGELLLSSESYQSAGSARAAITAITTNGLGGNFIIDSDKKGRYFFKLRNAQKSTLCVGETYAQLNSCQSAIDSVRRFLRTAKLVEGVEEK